MSDQKKSNPDFAVHWNDASSEFLSTIYCEDPARNDVAFLNEKMREPIVLLQTATTCIAVTELARTEPSTISLVPDRPAFCMMVSASQTAAAQYGYDGEMNHSSATGSILFLVPGKKITGRGSIGSFRTIMCSFETAHAERILGALEALSHEQLQGALNVRNSLITSILFRLMKEAMHPGPLSEAVVESCGNAMLVEFAHWLQTEHSVPDSRGKLTARHFAIIEEYLAGSNGKLPSVAELARACGFSERHFLKLFREQKKCSVAQYIKSVQISKAKTYLLDTDLPLKEIAFRLGFSSPANFSSAFRVATGITPGQMRKDK
jgi:AraC family transcriptional regulator